MCTDYVKSTIKSLSEKRKIIAVNKNFLQYFIEVLIAPGLWPLDLVSVFETDGPLTAKGCQSITANQNHPEDNEIIFRQN